MRHHLSLIIAVVLLAAGASPAVAQHRSSYSHSWEHRSVNTCQEHPWMVSPACGHTTCATCCAGTACAHHGCGHVTVAVISRDPGPGECHDANARLIDQLEGCRCLPQHVILDLRRRNDEALNACLAPPPMARREVEVRTVVMAGESPLHAAMVAEGECIAPAPRGDVVVLSRTSHSQGCVAAGCAPRVSSYGASWNTSIHQKVCGDAGCRPTSALRCAPPPPVPTPSTAVLNALKTDLLELQIRCTGGLPR